MVKRNQYEQFVTPFIAGVLFIAIYKLLDSTEYVLYGIGAILKVLYPIILAFVIAFVLYPLCKKTARARVLSVVVVYATAMVLIALIFYIIVPTLAESITSFARSVPDIVTSVLSEINRYPHFNVEPSKVFEHMEKYLNITPGSVSVLGLMNDTENTVTLLIDEDILKDEFFGCHPLVNTSSLKFKTSDLIEKIIPAIKHDYTAVKLTGED